MKKILIYKDNGVDPIGLSSLIRSLSSFPSGFISSKEMKTTPWEEQTSLLIIPGGRDIPYHEALKGEGNQRIRRYVERGGAFFGICAGAYFGCRRVEFDQGHELEVIGERELSFFPGIARGPAYGPGTFRYNSEYGSRAAWIDDTLHQTSLRCYFNGGCTFVEALSYPGIKVISRYLDIEEKPAAMIECPIGKGCVILSGVHIERETVESNEDNASRKQLFHAILNRLCASTYTV